jgi:ATP-dependent Clp protease ATP-binding subunit ClpA
VLRRRATPPRAPAAPPPAEAKSETGELRELRREVERTVTPGRDMVTMGKLPQTPRARQVIEAAIEEARNLNHDCVDVEHLLLGLLSVAEGVAAETLRKFGLELNAVRAEVQAEYARQGKPAGSGVLKAASSEAFTEAARRVMQVANQEAQRLNHEYIGTEHILLALLRETTGIAAEILKRCRAGHGDVGAAAAESPKRSGWWK